jgi:glycerophosphoryl diester phosphodiesterase
MPKTGPLAEDPARASRWRSAAPRAIVVAVHWSSFHRVGHGGASAIAPANTLASFDAALEIGVDMVEFDVRGWRGELLLAHTILDARREGKLRLRDALHHLAGRRFADVRLNVDLKHVGCERELVDRLDRAGLLGQTLISSQVPEVLDRLRAVEPRAWLGISVGGRVARTSRRWRNWRTQVLDGLTSGRWQALMAQHRLVDDGLLDDVAARQGLLYAWTVNERSAIEWLRRLGVHGVTTADPRLFASASA